MSDDPGGEDREQARPHPGPEKSRGVAAGRAAGGLRQPGAGFGRVVPGLLLAALVLACGEPRPETGFPAGLTPFSVQMHLHGHSHHNGSTQPGSMQWHSHFAAAEELDVLWWTDHSRILDQSLDLRLDAPDRSTLKKRIPLPSLQLVAAPREARHDRGEHRPRPDPEGDALLLRAGSEPGASAFAEYVYAFRSPGGGKFPNQTFARPVSSGAIITADFELGVLGENRTVEIRVPLSWHHRGGPILHELRYRLIDATGAAAGGAGPRLIDERTALVEIPWAPGRHTLTLDLEGDARAIRDGTDNSITDFQLVLAARDGADTTLKVHRLELHSRSPEPDHQIDRMREFAGRYEAEYRHRQHVGIEYASRPDYAIHVNAFFPRGVMTGELAVGDDETLTDPAEFVRRVHAVGGIVSYNHLFGTRIAQSKPWIQAQRSREMALELLGNDAWGCDLLEVGYKARGGVGLEYHLRTWDILTANGLFLYGNAVSDSHGGVWDREMKPNPYSTWIWAAEPSAEGLIAGIKRGRIVFGDAFRYRGRLYFRVGEHEMGDRTRVSDGPLPLEVAVDESFDPQRHRLFLVHGLIDRKGEQVTYLTARENRTGREIYPGTTTPVDVSRPSFVRIEMYDVDGKPLLFSNPIVFEAGSDP